MGGLSIWHWLIVLAVVLLLFGTGKVSTLMGDFAKGIKAFKKNMADDESMEASAERPPGSIAAPNAPINSAAPISNTGPIGNPTATTVPPHTTTTVHQG